MEYIQFLMAALATISGIVLGWTGRGRDLRRDLRVEASSDAHRQADIEYIKRGIDDIRVEQRGQQKELKEIDTRLTRVEESTKQAHLRINRVDTEQRQ